MTEHEILYIVMWAIGFFAGWVVRDAKEMGR